jgi:hypothetical protein
MMEPNELAWQGPMWNGCGACNFVRRAYARPYCVWCIKDAIHGARTLAGNLAVAAGMCRAFEQGAIYMARSVLRPGEPQAFTPGCELEPMGARREPRKATP